ncbi:glutaminyl-peptide cyclotransferase [Clupea harengus]|uniref:Glutaminyl-peptide cyclotransferase n=1 Tax=Clupea harengus TaxID=7950 RepID=A0A6P3W288_CLUHA|nr:glutaminyl-peptide cyclotransferase [Clupea harengus]
MRLRYRTAQLTVGKSICRCDQPPMCRVRALFFCLWGVLALALALGFSLSSSDTNTDEVLIHIPDLTKDKLTHRPRRRTVALVRRLVSQVDGQRLWHALLKPILIERLPGSKGSRAVRKHISNRLYTLSAGWTVQFDSFNHPTPRGSINFSNILAVLDPGAPRRLLLACHYDTKALRLSPSGPVKVFVGASDSAVPCAMMLELVTALDEHLRVMKQQRISEVTLQLVFFDGKEAIEQWTANDSLYGSRHLADQMAQTPHPPGATETTLIDAVDLLLLLDLIGAQAPMFVNHFDNTARWFDRLISAETRLHKLGLLSSHPNELSYFRKDVNMGRVEDDHMPFLDRGVPVMHMIATPFPPFMHTFEDTAVNIHIQTVENLTKVLAVFLSEYLGL